MDALTQILDRDREEALRSATRTLTLPDGTTHGIETYRVVWRWYDALIAYEFAAGADELHSYVLRTMTNQRCDAGEALIEVVAYLMTGTEARGGDLTDDTLVLDLARARRSRWQQRRHSA